MNADEMEKIEQASKLFVAVLNAELNEGKPEGELLTVATIIMDPVLGEVWMTGAGGRKRFMRSILSWMSQRDDFQENVGYFLMKWNERMIKKLH